MLRESTTSQKSRSELMRSSGGNGVMSGRRTAALARHSGKAAMKTRITRKMESC